MGLCDSMAYNYAVKQHYNHTTTHLWLCLGTINFLFVIMSVHLTVFTCDPDSPASQLGGAGAAPLHLVQDPGPVARHPVQYSTVQYSTVQYSTVPGVDPRVARLAAALAPADHAHQPRPRPAQRLHQRPARVSLARVPEYSSYSRENFECEVCKKLY